MSEGQQSYNHNYDLSYYFTRWAKIRKKVQSREATSRLASRDKIKVIEFFFNIKSGSEGGTYVR